MLTQRDERAAAVERAVPGAVRVRGKSDLQPLATRMRTRNVPGASVAVAHNGRVDWVRGYGVLSSAADRRVNEHTLFQAASISKPVAAFAAMILADRRRLDLDADVNDILKSWHVPDSPLTGRQRVTVRRILSHTAGLTVHGMPGYPAGAPLPTTTQILSGLPPATNEPVRVALEPGQEFQYSGGGYTVLELLIAEIAGQPFDEFVRETVLVPCGMADSTFAQPLPSDTAERAARGHTVDGALIPGGLTVLPALAASGLWTTAQDLVRFLLETQRALAGESRLLSRQAAGQMLAAQSHGPAALGFWLEGTGDGRRFFHTGSNEGYRAHAVGYFDDGRAAAVLTNGDEGGVLCLELLNAVADVYDWPGFIVEKVIADIDAAHLDRYAGSYDVAGMQVQVTREGDGLVATAPGVGSQRLFPETGTEFFFADMDGSVTFAPDDLGIRVVVRIGGERLTGRRI
jgi:CubicO group peptidase (beta-lactamase class C family)